MKDVISNEMLYEKINEAVNIICNTVGSTLGPCGNNVLINTDDKSPFITNDGVTIAESIESNDKYIHTILEIIKESTLKTNEQVGDGTTTTLVLLGSIINDGINEIKNGKNAFILSKELNNILNKLINKLEEYKMKPTKENILNIAVKSANDIEIGKLVYEVFNKQKNNNSIKLSESNSCKTYYETKKGYLLDIETPNIYFSNRKEIKLEDSYIFIIRGYLDNIEKISDIVNEGLERNKNIIILANDYDEQISEQLILYNIKENKNIYLFKTPEYGIRKMNIEEDISILTNSKIKNIDYENISFNDYGKCNIIFNKDNLTIINDNKNIKERVKELKKELNNNISDYDKEFILNRISCLTNGVTYIYVGGNTKTIVKEKIMRFEDSINAVSHAYNGILYGEGITYLKLSECLNDKIIPEKIIKNALNKPFQKIFENAGLDYSNIKNDIINSNYNKIYNFETNGFENINITNIIDPYDVELFSLINAISISSILLTTNYLVINENLKEKIEI